VTGAPPPMAVVYIAGRFTAPTTWDVEQNARRAEEIGFEVARLGASPLIPHTNTRYFHGAVQDAAFWYRATAALLLKADAVLMVPGWRTSLGARSEKDLATERGIPVFETPDALAAWLQAREVVV
jgi:hypothetical protein